MPLAVISRRSQRPKPLVGGDLEDTNANKENVDTQDLGRTPAKSRKRKLSMSERELSITWACKKHKVCVCMRILHLPD